MKVINLHEEKAKKDGIVTPKALTENLLNNIDKVDSLVYVAINKEGVYLYGTSQGVLHSTIGHLEVAKQLIIDDARE